MIDPETGLMIVEKEKLKEASCNYVNNLLTNRDPKEDYKAEFDVMEKLHDVRRLEDEESAQFSQEDFQDLLKQLSKKNKAKYHLSSRLESCIIKFFLFYLKKSGHQNLNLKSGRRLYAINFSRGKEKNTNLSTRDLYTLKRMFLKHLNRL